MSALASSSRGHREGGPVVEPIRETLRIEVSAGEAVTALAYRPAAPRDGAPAGGACPPLVLAHGAGADQTSAFMVRFATALAARGVCTTTFNFLYTEEGRRIPDRNDRLERCWRAVIAAVRSRNGARPLVIGGKSMGGRIASQIAARQVAAQSEDGIAGLVLLGYPLHPPRQPGRLRSAHFGRIRAPMLFVQGSRDPFGTPDELRTALKEAGAAAAFCVVEGGDHSLKVPKRGAVAQEEADGAVASALVDWLRALEAPPLR